jgi:hypothetical protein
MTEQLARKVLMSPELMDTWASRDVDGNLLRWDWRQPNGEIWEPTITTVYADNLVAARDAEIEKLRAALRQIAMTPKAHKVVASICEIALAPKP